jgi:hypothetical protein
MYRRERFAATILLGVLNCLFLLAISAVEVTGEEPFGIGKRVPAFILKDQHGKEHKINEQVRLVLFCREKKGNDIVGDALKETSPGYLSQHQTLFVADTSGMPRLIAKFVALPALRKKPYRVLLDPEPSVTKDFPSAKNKVTLLFLENLTIKAIEFVDNPADVRKAVEQKGPGNQVAKL